MDIRPNHKPLTRQQEAALIALNSCRSVADAARTSGVPESTLWRWLQQPEFQHRHRVLRRQQIEQGINHLQSLFGEAVDCLRRNLATGHAPSECRAALGIITKGIEGLEILDLDERISHLEQIEQERENQERRRNIA